MTEIEAQALKAAKAWRDYIAMDKRLSDDRMRIAKRSKEEMEQDAKDIRPAAARYKAELERLAQMVL